MVTGEVHVSIHSTVYRYDKEKVTIPDLEGVAACIHDGDGGGVRVVTLHGVKVRYRKTYHS